MLNDDQFFNDLPEEDMANMKTKKPGSIMKRHKIAKEKVSREDYTRIKMKLEEKDKVYRNLKAKVFKFQHHQSKMPKISSLNMITNIDSSVTNDTDEKLKSKNDKGEEASFSAPFNFKFSKAKDNNALESIEDLDSPDNTDREAFIQANSLCDDVDKDMDSENENEEGSDAE